MKPNHAQETMTHDNSDKPVYIVNLSTIHGLLSSSEVLNKFAMLYYDYAKNWLPAWLSPWLPAQLTTWSRNKYSQAWVRYNYLSMTGSLNDYNLGKINTETFVNQLQTIFSFLPLEKRSELVEIWNSLVILDEFAKKLKYLISQEAVICFVSNTNELHYQKIQKYIDRWLNTKKIQQGNDEPAKETRNEPTEKTSNWQEQIEGKYRFQVCGNIRSVTSYENGQFKWEGLVKNTIDQFLAEGYARESIIFVSAYPADLKKAEELGIESQSADQFFPKVEQTPDSLNTSPIPISIQAPLTLASSRPVFTKVPKKQSENCIEEVTSEKASLLGNR